MKRPTLEFHHIGLASRIPDSTLALLRAIGFEAGFTVEDKHQNVMLALCEAPGAPRIEVVSPTAAAGPLDNILKGQEVGVYHLCFTTPDRSAAIEFLRACGFSPILVAPAKPAILFGGQTVSFHFIKGLGLVELLELRPSV